ncbi:hypothetical protein MKK64_13695 [Methylobacterium sp. E-025]|uniref:hypothetical protein n=1 Tax=Methylobacterium sp. E-025 TaxID=2836561 RepID=UPI001FB98793|nr:hypothetical protein [Methylobacterium sp. E-025]MCJ2112238.1 hypothetical protein [Methylobacterium sp. E-025]
MKSKSADPNVDLFFATMTFKHFGDLQRVTALDIMRREVGIFAGALLKRLFRNPNSSILTERNFAVLLFPDLPVRKSKVKSNDYKKNLDLTSVNNGLHLHGPLMIPKISRLRGESLIDHINRKPATYCPKHGKIQEIHLVPITDAEKATAYAAKHLYRGSFDTSDMIVAPKARSEM